MVTLPFCGLSKVENNKETLLGSHSIETMNGHFIRTTDDIVRYLQQDPKELKMFIKENATAGNDVYLNISDTWAGMNFLVNEHVKFGPYPLGYLVLSRNKLKGSSTFSNLSYNSAQVVGDIHARLGSMNKALLKERFVPQRFQDEAIFPEDRWEDEDAFDKIFDNFKKLRKFYQTCNETGSAIIMYTAK